MFERSMLTFGVLSWNYKIFTLAAIFLPMKRASYSVSAKWSETPEILVCTAPPPSYSLVTTSPVAALTSGWDKIKNYRSSQENSSVFLDNDILISHGRDVGSTSRAASQHQRYLGNSLGWHLSHIVKDSSEMSLSWENIALPGKVGSSWINKVEAGKFVFHGNLLGSEMFLDSDGVISSSE